MEMAGKNSDHYFCSWQAKKMEKTKSAELPDLVDQKNCLAILSTSVDGGPIGSRVRLATMWLWGAS
jgi:hypothetical protein